MKPLFRIITLLVFGLVHFSAKSHVSLPAIIGSDMVLQQGIKLPIWGWACPGEKIEVSIAKDNLTITADAKGKWKVVLNPLQAGHERLSMIIKGSHTTITLTNILVGEVWLLSGQSNMEWPLSLSKNSEYEVLRAYNQDIRLFQVKNTDLENEATDTEGNWAICDAMAASSFSAVGYYFGKELYEKLDVPIGLINSTWGGTPAEAWVRKSVLEKDTYYDEKLAVYDSILTTYNGYNNAINAWWDWIEKKIQWNKEKRPKPKAPPMPYSEANNPWNISGMYNGMIAPLAPFAIKGVIWYQGESNAKEALKYKELFPNLIKDWRDVWAQGDFPFYYVQIAPLRAPFYGEKEAAMIREAQLETLEKVKNTGMVVTTDLGNLMDIHPRNKRDVGKRLCLWALSQNYGRDVVYSGPLYKDMTIVKDEIILSFDHVGGGLVARDSALTFFFIAGKDKQFYPGTAKIRGQQVIVSNKNIKRPVAVRFAFSNDAIPNFYNKEGLPASPFRTDDWKL